MLFFIMIEKREQIKNAVILAIKENNLKKQNSLLIVIRQKHSKEFPIKNRIQVKNFKK